jgi:hypothetical protein
VFELTPGRRIGALEFVAPTEKRAHSNGSVLWLFRCIRCKREHLKSATRVRLLLKRRSSFGCSYCGVISPRQVLRRLKQSRARPRISYANQWLAIGTLYAAEGDGQMEQVLWRSLIRECGPIKVSLTEKEARALVQHQEYGPAEWPFLTSVLENIRTCTVSPK